MFGQTPPNTNKNVVLLLTVKPSIYLHNLYEKLQKYDLWSNPPKIDGVVAYRKNSNL